MQRLVALGSEVPTKSPTNLDPAVLVLLLVSVLMLEFVPKVLEVWFGEQKCACHGMLPSTMIAECSFQIDSPEGTPC